MSKRLLQGSGAPSFCWSCFAQLQRAPGKGKGLFYFALVQDKAGVVHRVHGDCLQATLSDGDVKEWPDTVQTR
jgi:hypothetical protein